MSDAYEDLQREVKIYNGRLFGQNVSKYGVEQGYLDYSTLARIVGDRVLNNNIMAYTGYDDWDLMMGDYDSEIYQYYIITESGYQILSWLTPDENVFYHDELDMFVWGITHFGTSWDYVLTDLKLIEKWGDE